MVDLQRLPEVTQKLQMHLVHFWGRAGYASARGQAGGIYIYICILEYGEPAQSGEHNHAHIYIYTCLTHLPGHGDAAPLPLCVWVGG